MARRGNPGGRAKRKIPTAVRSKSKGSTHRSGAKARLKSAKRSAPSAVPGNFY